MPPTPVQPLLSGPWGEKAGTGGREHIATPREHYCELRDTFAASSLMIIAENYGLIGPDGLARSRWTVGV